MAGQRPLGLTHSSLPFLLQGVPFPQNEANAMDVVVQFAIHRLGFQPQDIIIYAWSIGGFTGTSLPAPRTVGTFRPSPSSPRRRGRGNAGMAQEWGGGLMAERTEVGSLSGSGGRCPVRVHVTFPSTLVPSSSKHQSPALGWQIREWMLPLVPSLAHFFFSLLPLRAMPWPSEASG